MIGLLYALIAAYIGWWLWQGPSKKQKKAVHRRPSEPAIDEARAVLGLDARAGEAEIRAAHRRLIAAVHPDRGGSPELARRINAARDLLLKRAPD